MRTKTISLTYLSLFAIIAGTGGCGTASHHAGDSANLETIAILGTNDLHGAIAPQQMKSREKDEDSASIEYEVGGAAVLAAYANILRSEFGPRLLWLDAGDEFQGSIESNSEKGAPMVRFFNLAGLHAAAIGNHEFDFGPEHQSQTDILGALKARMSEATYPYLSANIFEKKTKKPAALPNLQPYVVLPVGKLRVGVIGLTTTDTPSTTRPSNVADLDFTDLKAATLSSAKAAREAGAQVVIVLAHVGLKCSPGRLPQTHLIRRPTDQQGECGPNDELVELMNELPQGAVDAVISGHSHQIIHQWIAGTPVVQAGAFGQYINIIYLTYDLSGGKLLTEKTLIEGPVPICRKVFKNQNDCNGMRQPPRNGRGPLVNAEFHKKQIKPDHAVLNMLEPLFQKTSVVKSEVIGQAARPIEHQRFEESELGNLIADAIREAAGTDASIVNAGGIRAPIEAGAITYGAVFRTFPFENAISILKLSGSELRLLLQIMESGARGFHPVSGLRLTVIDPKQDAAAIDLDNNEKVEPWEVNRLLTVKLDNGKPIKDKATYSVALPDFLAAGGDDMAWFMNKLHKAQIKMDSGILMRDAIVNYIKHLSKTSAINTEENPLILKSDARLILKTSKTIKKSYKRKGRRYGKRAHS
ncbi:MAG: bifunctional UDP-sugar hydrolase/5'-nucleotidase [Bdellovibrionota bacterium]